MKQRQITTKVDAFSLVEICVALGVVSFCLVALLGLFQAGLRQERQSLDQMRAAHILSAVADDVQGLARRPDETSAATNSQFGLRLPSPGQLALEGSFAVDEGAAPSQTEKAYVVHYRIVPPAAAEGVFKTHKIRIIVAWPGAATFDGSGTNLALRKASGSVEAILELNRG